MSKLKETVDERYHKSTIRQYLKEELKLSSRLIRSASLDKRILVNGKAVKMRCILKDGDVVEVILDTKETQNIAPEKMDIDVIYEDSEVLVVNKPPYMVVHPTKTYQSGTLANGIINYFRENNEDCIVRLVSRLDMNTSGLIIVAKNQFAHMTLSRVMQENHLEKRYIAVVHGHMEESEGTIDAPIYRPEGEEFGIRRIIDERGQRSVTHYKVLESLKDSDIVECLLETGRTHQIRVHLSSIGHPIYGDTLYGYGEEEENLIKRQALHAYGLSFESPRTKERLDLRSELPEDMKCLIEKLR